MLNYLSLELRRMSRDGGYVIMTVAVPAAMYLAMSGLGTHLTADEAAFAMIGFAGFGALGGATNNGVGLAEDRALGWLRQLRLTPLRPGQVVVARGLCGLLLTVPAILVVFACGALSKGVHLAAGQWLGALALLWVGVTPIVLLGLAFGYLLAPSRAQAAGALAYLGLAVIGGLFAPVTLFPSWVQAISRWTPVYRYAELAGSAAGHGGVPLGGLAILGGWTALFAALAVLGYRRGAAA